MNRVPVVRTDLVKRLLDMAPVKVGSGDKAVVVFFDFKCPFCAKFFLNVEDVLLELAKMGKITFAMCDFLVHRHAMPLHQALRCAGDKLQFVRDAFGGVKVAGGQCSAEEVEQCEALAKELGVRGTPSTLFFNFARQLGYLHFGYMDPNSVIDAVSKL